MISIILSAHNEEKNIKNILFDLKRELNYLECGWELFICLSDCTDKTEEIAKRTIDNLGIKTIILKTPMGKVRSQKLALEFVDKRSFGILFLDCDIRLGKKAIYNMISEAKYYPTIKLFYAKEIPLKREDIFYNIINVRTLNPDYVIAKENVRFFHPYTSNKKGKVFATGGMYLVRKGVYDVDEEIGCDDIYLTHSIYHRFGFGTIKQSNSIIYYQPVYTFRNWISKWNRIWSSVDNLYKKHPEFSYLSKYMGLRIDFSKLLRELRTKLFFYFILERSWNSVGKLILKNFGLKKTKVWRSLEETKEVKLK